MMDPAREMQENKKGAPLAANPIEVRGSEIFIQIDDDRIVPVLSGGMVEAALNEFGGRLIEIEPGIPFGLN